MFSFLSIYFIKNFFHLDRKQWIHKFNSTWEAGLAQFCVVGATRLGLVRAVLEFVTDLGLNYFGPVQPIVFLVYNYCLSYCHHLFFLRENIATISNTSLVSNVLHQLYTLFSTLVIFFNNHTQSPIRNCSDSRCIIDLSMPSS